MYDIDIMISRTVISLALLLAPSCMAIDFNLQEDHRDLKSGGVNMCANYDIVAPRIAGGQDSCGCEGRKIVCNFKDICNLDDNCATLEMDIDFTVADQEQITYLSTYLHTHQTSQLTLDVSTDPEKDGIQGCNMQYGNETCVCQSCATGKGVKILCEEVATQGCQPIDVKNFERYVPFFGIDYDELVQTQNQKPIVAQAVQENQASGGVSAVKLAAGAIGAVFSLAVII